MNPFEPASNINFCGIDFEGSGASKTLKDAPIQIGLASLTPTPSAYKTNWEITPMLESYLNPGQRINSFAYRIHKIGFKEVSNAPKLYTFYQTIEQQANTSIFVGHGHSTEKRYLKSAFPLLKIEWVDTLKIARSLYPNLEGHKLEKCFQITGKEEELKQLVPNRTWHNALFDTVASLLFLKHCLELPELKRVTLCELQSPPPPPKKSRKK